jgi:archaellum component FlaC
MSESQQTKIDVAIQEIKYKIEAAEREYESVITKINTLRDVLDNLDKIKRNEKLK